MSFSYKSVADRNYQRYASAYSNIAYLHHPSGVSVIILNEVPQSEVIAVDFGSHKKHGVDRGLNTVVGKGKKGGLQLQKETRLCTVRCKNGEEIIVRAGVRGTLAEVNARLKENPDLVRTASENQGYIAIVTYGAGKRKPDEFDTELPEKRVHLTNEKLEPVVPSTEKIIDDDLNEKDTEPIADNSQSESKSSQ
ncbi:unnamed protein product [Auanema sp. JU1783]|nr:unnamed protein product [Auanema sp. JU1783]